MFINTKTAKTLGLTIPKSVLLRADRREGCAQALTAGDSNVDIVGVDHTEDPRADYVAEYKNLLSLGKPFGISEGSIGDSDGSGNYDMRRAIAHIKEFWPRCVFFIQFDNDHVGDDPDSVRWDIAGNRFGAELLADPWVVNAPIFPGAGGDPKR